MKANGNMKKIGFTILILLSFGSVSYAEVDHSELIEGTYTTGSEVTEGCLECHDTIGEDFIKTAHWLWKGDTPFLKGHEKASSFGKINMMNGY